MFPNCMKHQECSLAFQHHQGSQDEPAEQIVANTQLLEGIRYLGIAALYVLSSTISIDLIASSCIKQSVAFS